MGKNENFIVKQSVLINVCIMCIAITGGLLLDYYADKEFLNCINCYFISGLLYFIYYIFNFFSPRKFIVTENTLIVCYNMLLYFKKRRFQISNINELTIKVAARSMIMKIVEKDGVKKQKTTIWVAYYSEKQLITLLDEIRNHPLNKSENIYLLSWNGEYY